MKWIYIHIMRGKGIKRGGSAPSKLPLIKDSLFCGGAIIQGMLGEVLEGLAPLKKSSHPSLKE